MPNERSKLLLQIFKNTNYAIARTAGNGSIWYDPVTEPLSEDMIELHLEGKTTLASYQLQADERVTWLGWDIDAAGDLEQARRMTRQILTHLDNIPYVVEYSGNKGYHVLVFLQEPVSASFAKKIVDYVRDKEQLPRTESKATVGHVESYPKQDKLSKTTEKRKALGNCLKIPLGQHPKTHNWSIFVDPDNNWEDGAPISPEEVLQYRATQTELEAIAADKETDREQFLVELLTEHWREGQRHELALYLSGYMANMGWSEEATSQLISKIATAAGDPDIPNRLKTVEDTFIRTTAGSAVAGFSRLGDLLPGQVMQVLIKLIPEMLEPNLIREIEKIRLSRGDSWIKVKNVIQLIWSDLLDRGQFLIDPMTQETYWFDNDTHLLIMVDSDNWVTLLYKFYHINTAENFYRQIAEGIHRQASVEGRYVEIRRRAAFEYGSLYVNLGGSEVYILDGDTIRTSYNGECGYMFHTELGLEILPAWEGEPVDALEYLTADLNFVQSDRAPLPPAPQKELLKAWIMATFFKELLPTRPILALLGESGSGKTTAARRILRVLESPAEDVLQALMDKPDFFRASVASHHIMVLDNLEKSGARWMVDSLNLIATGSHIELRKLYHTNEVYKIRPNVWAIITAVQMPFPDETLISRLLTLDMQRLTTFLPEHSFRYNLNKNLPALWADLLRKLNVIVKQLRASQKVSITASMRLADFSVFCKRLKGTGIFNDDNLEYGLKMLSSSQVQALARSENNIVPVLEKWLHSHPDEAAKSNTIRELYQVWMPLAINDRKNWRWSTPQALWSHLSALKEFLISEYGASYQKSFNPQNGREEWHISFPTAIEIAGSNGKDTYVETIQEEIPAESETQPDENSL